MMSVDGWEPRSLLALADYINGYAFKPDDWGKEGLPIIRIEQLKNPDGPVDYYAGQLPSAVVIDDGDLIFSWSASLFLRIWTHGRAALNQHLFKVIERDGVDRLFLKAFIEFYLPDLIKASHGSTMQHITRKELERFAAPFPRYEHEQAKIAEVLSTVDRAIEQTEALIAKQQRIKTGLIQDLLTRGIDEQGNLRSEQTHEFKDSLLGRVPVEWEVITLGAMLKRARGYLQTGPFGSQLHAYEYVHEGTPIIMPQNILDGQISTSGIARIPERRANELHRHRLLPNDVVFSRRGDLSRAAGIGERETGWICGTGCFLLRVAPDAIESTWLANVYRLHHVQRQVETNAVGSTMPSLNNAVMENLIVAFPKADEQQEIMRRCGAAADGIASTFNQLAKMRAIKRGLMGDLLTGNRRVTALVDQREEVTT